MWIAARSRPTARARAISPSTKRGAVVTVHVAWCGAAWRGAAVGAPICAAIRLGRRPAAVVGAVWRGMAAVSAAGAARGSAWGGGLGCVAEIFAEIFAEVWSGGLGCVARGGALAAGGPRGVGMRDGRRAAAWRLTGSALGELIGRFGDLTA